MILYDIPVYMYNLRRPWVLGPPQPATGTRGQAGPMWPNLQKRKINTIGDLNNIINKTLRSSEKTLLIAIYNNQNQRRYIGVKLD